MEYIVPFDIQRIYYNCKTCKGACCYNIHTSLIFTIEQMKQISKCRIYDAYGSLFYKTNKSYSINVPGKCWFNGYRGCLLGENRSYDCQLYPYYPINLNEDYTVVLLKLCPNMGSEIVNNACTQSRERIIELVKKSEELSKREGYKRNIIDEKYRISDYIPEKINLVKCASLKYSTVEDFLKLVFFQLVFVPPMIFLESEIIFKLFDIYMYYMYSLIKADASQNIQNMQIFLENRIFKVALYRYFYPWNEKVLLSENENIILFNYYQKRDLNSKVIKVLNLYFKDENTIWKKAY